MRHWPVCAAVWRGRWHGGGRGDPDSIGGSGQGMPQKIRVQNLERLKRK